MPIGIQSHMYYLYGKDDCNLFTMGQKLYIVDPLLIFKSTFSCNCFSCFIVCIISPILGIGTAL